MRQFVESVPGYKLLSSELMGTRRNLLIECGQGHRYNARWDSFCRGNRCVTCFNEKQRLSFDHVKADFEAAGWTVLSTDYRNRKSPLEVRCRQGHFHKVSYESVSRGNYCDTCARKSGYGGNKGTLEKCRAMVEADPGYKLLDTVYQPHPWKIHVRCPNGHEYKVLKGSFSGGARCRRCSAERNSGTNHYFWRHDLTPEQRKSRREERRSQKAKCWKKDVLKRDGYACQKCGSRKGLVAHHIKNWIDYAELRYEVSNGTTLCSPCHEAFHSRFGKRYNNEDQLACFMGQ